MLLWGGAAPGNVDRIHKGQRGVGIPNDGEKHHLRIVLKRVKNGGLEMNCSVDNQELASMEESAEMVLTTKFDEFALGFAGPDDVGEFTLDNFKITAHTQQALTSIPSSSTPNAAFVPTLREWTNREGRTLKATLLAFDDLASTVSIRMEDGREFTLPLDTLSEADVAYVRESAASLSAVGGWVAQYPEPLKNETAKLESGSALLKNLRDGHPRLMMLEDDLASLKELVVSDPIAAKLYDNVQKIADRYLD